MPSVSESESDGNLEGSDENKVNTDKDGSECKSDDTNSFDVIENDERYTGNDENDGESVDIEEYDNETGSHTDDEGSVLDTNGDYKKHCTYHESDEKT
ncbi:hypothetical protein DPMN_089220 [Dreissena polymorpha]|uniref:Uncharacterized protein n=1 Tax=Dreissena polymorpha TaxID=45954 RepID=A0A9D4QXV5_DREPO|nr:hypothetical protein DPMN_089220 [Dreissena polymorpha]